MKDENTHDAGLPHDGSDRKKSVTDNELKRKGAVGLALFLAYASGEEDPLRAEQRIQRNADRRAKIEKARIKARKAEQERRKADKLADAFLVRPYGLKLPVTPSVQADIDSILGVDSSKVCPGFPLNRLVETIRASGLDGSKLLEKAARRAARRCSGLVYKAPPPKQVEPETPRTIVWVNNDLQAEEMKQLREQLRGTRNRLLSANGAQPSVAGCHSRLVEATAELLAKIGQKYPGLEHDLESLGCAIVDFGGNKHFVELLFDKFLSITFMPPDPIRDLLYDRVEWKELPNVS